MKRKATLNKMAEALEHEADEVAASCEIGEGRDCAEEQDVADRLRRAAATLRGEGSVAESTASEPTASDGADVSDETQAS